MTYPGLDSLDSNNYMELGGFTLVDNVAVDDIRGPGDLPYFTALRAPCMSEPCTDIGTTRGTVLPFFDWSDDPTLMCKSDNHPAYTDAEPYMTFKVVSPTSRNFGAWPTTDRNAGSKGDSPADSGWLTLKDAYRNLQMLNTDGQNNPANYVVHYAADAQYKHNGALYVGTIDGNTKGYAMCQCADNHWSND